MLHENHSTYGNNNKQEVNVGGSRNAERAECQMHC